MSEGYFRKVEARAAALFEGCSQDLPDERYEIRARLEGKHSSKVTIEVVANPRAHWVCDEPLTRVVDTLNEEFQNDRQFGGIELEVPADWADGFGDNFEPLELGARLRVKRSEHG